MCAFACAPCMRVLRVRERVPCAGPRHHWPSPASRACRPPKPRVRARWVRRRPCDARASRASPPSHRAPWRAWCTNPPRPTRTCSRRLACCGRSRPRAAAACLPRRWRTARRCCTSCNLPPGASGRATRCPGSSPTPTPALPGARLAAAPSPRRVLSSSPQPRAAGRCELAALWEAALADLAPSLHGALLLADGDAMRALCWGVRGDLASRLDALGCTLLPLGTPLPLGGPHALAPPPSAALAEAAPRAAVVLVSRFLPEAHEALLRSLCQSGVRHAEPLLPATRGA